MIMKTHISNNMTDNQRIYVIFQYSPDDNPTWFSYRLFSDIYQFDAFKTCANMYGNSIFANYGKPIHWNFDIMGCEFRLIKYNNLIEKYVSLFGRTWDNWEDFFWLVMKCVYEDTDIKNEDYLYMLDDFICIIGSLNYLIERSYNVRIKLKENIANLDEIYVDNQTYLSLLPMEIFQHMLTFEHNYSTLNNMFNYIENANLKIALTEHQSFEIPDDKKLNKMLEEFDRYENRIRTDLESHYTFNSNT